jgi:hypothetical protein
VLSDVLIVALKYAPGSSADLPSSVVVKISKDTPETRKTAVDNGYYTKECKFFRSFGDQVPMTVPRCYGVFEDPADVGTFCIVMEDMTTNWIPGSVYAGIGFDAIMGFVKEAARMHGKFWKSDTLKEDWLNSTSADGLYNPPIIADVHKGAQPEIFKEYIELATEFKWTAPPAPHGDGKEHDSWPPPSFNPLNPENSERVINAVLKKLGASPKTLIHG